MHTEEQAKTLSPVVDVEALKKLAEKATPGPWRVGKFMPAETIGRHQVMAIDGQNFPYVILEGNQNFIEEAECNAAYAAAANPAAILELLEQRRLLLEALKESYEYIAAQKPETKWTGAGYRLVESLSPVFRVMSQMATAIARATGGSQ